MSSPQRELSSLVGFLEAEFLDARRERGGMDAEKRGRAAVAIHPPAGPMKGREDVLALLALLVRFWNHGGVRLQTRTHRSVRQCGAVNVRRREIEPQGSRP